MSALRQEILVRIRKLYADSSVARSRTKADLEEIRDEVEQLIETLADVDADEEGDL